MIVYDFEFFYRFVVNVIGYVMFLVFWIIYLYKMVCGGLDIGLLVLGKFMC